MSDDPLVPVLLRAWSNSLGGEAAWQALSDRNFVYRITAPGGEFILKIAGQISPQGDPERKLAAEYDLLRYLKDCGVPVAVPLSTNGGQHLLRYEGRLYTLTPSLPQAIGEDDDLSRVFYNSGAAIALLHRALAAYTGPIYSWTMDLPPRILNDMVPIIVQHQSEEERAQFNAVIDSIRAPLTSSLSGLPSQYIHGDCHGGNMLRVGEQINGFIDLDHLPFGPRIYDLCYRLTDDGKKMINDRSTARRWFKDLVPSLFAGYEQAFPLTVAEKDAVPYMMMSICLLFTGWLFEHNMLHDIARDNLLLFYWLHENRDSVRAAVS